MIIDYDKTVLEHFHFHYSRFPSMWRRYCPTKIHSRHI